MGIAIIQNDSVLQVFVSGVENASEVESWGNGIGLN